MTANTRRHRGYANWKSGFDGETLVSNLYDRSGMQMLATRWRGTSGEIDLILRNGNQIVFVEVKRAANFDRAIERLGPGQVARIQQTADEYLGSEPDGLLTDCRFDLALVDRAGRVHLVENVLAA